MEFHTFQVIKKNGGKGKVHISLQDNSYFLCTLHIDNSVDKEISDCYPDFFNKERICGNCWNSFKFLQNKYGISFSYASRK